MINSIIFSRDRASQLKLLLDSLNKNAPGVFNLNVIYCYSSLSYKEGYNKLIEEYGNKVNFIEESCFEDDVKLTLNSDYGFSIFFTDDNVLYRPINEDEIVSSFDDDEVFCFSLRLGTNVTWCYTMSVENKLIEYETLDNLIKWDWSKHYLDFGYPLSLEGHIFKTKEILKFTKKIQFDNPNKFEYKLQVFNNFPKQKMSSYKESALVSIPNNIVNRESPNISGTKYGVSTEVLNSNFILGNYINLDDLDFNNIKGCYQEIDYKIKVLN